MAGVVDFPGARNRVLLAAWKHHAAGWCPVANASRRAMRSWYRLDRGANRQGYVTHAVGAAFGFDPATVRIEPPEADAVLFRFNGPCQRPRTLERLAGAVDRTRLGRWRSDALREIRRERRLTAGILAELGASGEVAA